jgi:hypothetical protein
MREEDKMETRSYRENLHEHLVNILKQGKELGEIAQSLLENRMTENLNELDNEIVLTRVSQTSAR